MIGSLSLRGVALACALCAAIGVLPNPRAWAGPTLRTRRTRMRTGVPLTATRLGGMLRTSVGGDISSGRKPVGSAPTPLNKTHGEGRQMRIMAMDTNELYRQRSGNLVERVTSLGPLIATIAAFFLLGGLTAHCAESFPFRCFGI